ncbi:Major Facilitator Superfamily [Geosmithia morbida]|uniref:Major Facilitator Superfamily n=1 Tax=Geosmithia morbida TaxID=1094350 RepID=A0A9P4YTE2_9HYPO|nr:Major Facilitator Superfamily [Geosmithia morbida]KAF4122202.1 Major Facilitator Superfamily [Geosmithia morbida]
MDSSDSKTWLETLHGWYRGTLYQAIVLGLISFSQPGIWNALSSMGAGGLASPFFVNAANVITYVIMVLFCPVFSVIGNRFSLKWILVFGTVGYLPYFAALYCNSVYGTRWFLIFGAVTCGFSAAALWTSEAAIAVAYPEDNRRGLYIGIWMAIGLVGTLIGSSIQLALNIDDSEQGSLSTNSYLVMIGLSCMGLPLALTISPPEKLRRTDGTKPTFSNGAARMPLRQSVGGLWHALGSKHILLLLPIFITVRWSTTYQGNYLTAYFSVRGRSLAGFVQTVCGIIATVGWGRLLDSQTIFRSKRSLCNVGWYSMLAVFVVQWIFNFYMQAELQSRSPSPVLDIFSADYAKAVVAYCLFGISANASVVWTYWILSMYNSDMDRLSHTSGILRSAESLGFACAYGIGSKESVSLMTNLAVSFAVFAAAVPFTCYVAWKGKALEETSATPGDREEDSEGNLYTDPRDEAAKVPGTTTIVSA